MCPAGVPVPARGRRRPLRPPSMTPARGVPFGREVTPRWVAAPAPPASVSEAIEMMHAGLGYLAAADAAQLGAETQARCLRALEEAAAAGTAARASVLAAFTAGQGYCADADYSPRAWLMHKTGVTKGAAAGHMAWARRAAAHPQVVAALAL